MNENLNLVEILKENPIGAKVSTLEKRGFEIEAYSEGASAKAVENHIRNTYPHELAYNKKAVEFENFIKVEVKE